MEDEEKAKLINQALNRSASAFMFQIKAFENEHTQKTLNTGIVGYIKLFEDNVELLAKSIDRLNYVSKDGWEIWDLDKQIQSVLISRTPKTLTSAHNLIITGYYDEGLAVCRMAYENLLAICFLQKNPQNADSVITYGFKKQFKKQLKLPSEKEFKPSNVLTQELKIAEEDEMYSFLSMPIHGNKFAVWNDIMNAQKGCGFTFNLGFSYDEEDLSLAFNHLMAILYLSLCLFKCIFGKYLKDTQLLDDKAIEALKIFIGDFPDNHFFAKYPEVVDKILAAIQIKNNN